MKEAYNSHIVKVRDLLWARDRFKLAEALDKCSGEHVLLRAEQAHLGKKELQCNGSELEEALKGLGLDLESSFHAELITRSPTAQAPVLEALHDCEGFRDHNDSNSLHWGGARGDGEVLGHPVRNAPMFFRDNGMNVDLVDLYRGSSVFLILNGPSFAEVDHSKLREPGILTFGINNGAHAFRPHFWTSVDDPTRFMESIWADPLITKFVPMAHFQKPIWDVQANTVSQRKVKSYPNVIGFRRNEQFLANQWLYEDTINWGNHKNRGGGRSVMLSALRLCFLLGFRRVFLLGCDFHMDTEKRYWFPEERSNAAIRNNTNAYQMLSNYFKELLPHFEEANFEVINCTPNSRLDVFPKWELDKALEQARVDTSATTEGMYVNRFKK